MSYGGGGSGRGRGRGAYFKEKYGGGGRGRGGHSSGREESEPMQLTEPAEESGEPENEFETTIRHQGTDEDLKRVLRRIDGAGYKAYNDIRGSFSFPTFQLIVDWIQSDPFAPPSRMRARVPANAHRFPSDHLEPKIRNTALADYLTRQFCQYVSARKYDEGNSAGGGWSGPKGGELRMTVPGQQVLQRTSVVVTRDYVEARFTVALPARGRSIMGAQAITILTQYVPTAVMETLVYEKQNKSLLRQFITCIEDQDTLRRMICAQGLIAFIPNGATLPRASGASDKRLEGPQVLPFQSPPSMEREFVLPNKGSIRGMAIPKGVTLVVGGGFHGKSTVLRALEVGIYNHIPGDGREYVSTNPKVVKIRAEDGRFVESVDITPFINNLPFGKPTTCFSTTNASGSTSQAANLMEALELGALGFLIDEDTCATNFMIRDQRMQQLVSKDNEPITPLIYKIRKLYEELDVSSVLVIGGSGDYFDVADRVVMMQSYVPRDVTREAKEIARRNPSKLADEGGSTFGPIVARVPDPSSFSASIGYKNKIRAQETRSVQFGEEEIDLSAIEQLVEGSQTRVIGDALLYLKSKCTPERTLLELMEGLELEFDEKGLDVVSGGRIGGTYSRPRMFEIAAALNRLRTVKMIQKRGKKRPHTSSSR